MSKKLGSKREDHHSTLIKSFSLPEETLKAIEDYKFDFRKDNTSVAANELIQLGLRYLKLREKKKLAASS